MYFSKLKCRNWLLMLLHLTKVVAQAFMPAVTVNSCANNKVTITLSNASIGGLVYIQGAGQGCSHETVPGTNHFEFPFLSCSLVWGQPFRLVVQKKRLYQTGDDKVIPITCTVDLSHITLETIINPAPKDIEPPRTVMIKPSAFMTLTHGGFNISSRGINIGELITLQIELYNQYKGGAFDINVNRCTASNVLLISGGCATDTSVFPQFSKPRTGILQSTFKAFIPTDQLSTGRVVFACTLDVCLNSCPMQTCPPDGTSNGRKKRTEESTSFNQIQVQSSLIVSPIEDPLVEKNILQSNTICLHWGSLVGCVVMVIMAILIVISFAVQTRRWKLKYKKAVRNTWKLVRDSSPSESSPFASTESIESGFTIPRADRRNVPFV